MAAVLPVLTREPRPVGFFFHTLIVVRERARTPKNEQIVIGHAQRSSTDTKRYETH